MKTREIFSLIKFQLLYASPIVIVFLLAAFLFGCQQKNEEPKVAKPQVTIENLQTAYGKSVRRNRMYVLFIKQAEKEKLKNVANLYRAIARSEEIHANNHASLLRQQGIEPVVPPDEPVVVGTTLQTFKMAMSSEELEYESMYPNLIRTAELEKYAEAVEQFKKTQDADARHGELIKEALDKAGKIVKVPYFLCPGCGYIMTSDKTEQCPVCKATKDKFEKI